MGMMFSRRRVDAIKKREDLKEQAKKERSAEAKVRHGNKPKPAPEEQDAKSKGTK